MASMPLVWRNRLQRKFTQEYRSGRHEIDLPEAKQHANRDGWVVGRAFFFRSAGARFTVIRRSGNSQSLLRRAARTRSLASWTAVSGNPMMFIAGTQK
jgi:hypothetical protein